MGVWPLWIVELLLLVIIWRVATAGRRVSTRTTLMTGASLLLAVIGAGLVFVSIRRVIRSGIGMDLADLLPFLPLAILGAAIVVYFWTVHHATDPRDF